MSNMNTAIRIGLRDSIKRYGKAHTKRVGLELIFTLEESEWKRIYIEEFKRLFPMIPWVVFDACKEQK